MLPELKLIVGLGNPGHTYAKTRHNVGVWLVEAIADKYHGVFKLDKKFQGTLCQVTIEQQLCQLLIPTTFMNHSGQAVQAVAHFYKITPPEILVVHDDLDLAPGVSKLKIDGGHGGHNGLRDITQCLGSQQFHRLRLGIGHPGHRDQVLSYVLGKPSATDELEIHRAIQRAITILPEVVKGDWQKAMNWLHSE